MYSQIALLDAESDESYPEWQTGEENVVFGSKGIAVATKGDIKVDVAVFKGQLDFDIEPLTLLISHRIQIGNEGILVGNIVAADVLKLDWPEGDIIVSVYANGVREQVTRVVFVLDEIRA